MGYLSNCKSETSSVCNVVEDYRLQAMKLVHHYANGCFGWLISGSRALTLREKQFLYRVGNTRFTFVTFNTG